MFFWSSKEEPKPALLAVWSKAELVAAMSSGNTEPLHAELPRFRAAAAAPGRTCHEATCDTCVSGAWSYATTLLLLHGSDATAAVFACELLYALLPRVGLAPVPSALRPMLSGSLAASARLPGTNKPRDRWYVCGPVLLAALTSASIQPLDVGFASVDDAAAIVLDAAEAIDPPALASFGFVAAACGRSCRSNVTPTKQQATVAATCFAVMRRVGKHIFPEDIPGVLEAVAAWLVACSTMFADCDHPAMCAAAVRAFQLLQRGYSEKYLHATTSHIELLLRAAKAAAGDPQYHPLHNAAHQALGSVFCALSYPPQLLDGMEGQLLRAGETGPPPLLEAVAAAARSWHKAAAGATGDLLPVERSSMRIALRLLLRLMREFPQGVDSELSVAVVRSARAAAETLVAAAPTMPERFPAFLDDATAFCRAAAVYLRETAFHTFAPFLAALTALNAAQLARSQVDFVSVEQLAGRVSELADHGSKTREGCVALENAIRSVTRVVDAPIDALYLSGAIGEVAAVQAATSRPDAEASYAVDDAVAEALKRALQLSPAHVADAALAHWRAWGRLRYQNSGWIRDSAAVACFDHVLTTSREALVARPEIRFSLGVAPSDQRAVRAFVLVLLRIRGSAPPNVVQAVAVWCETINLSSLGLPALWRHVAR